MTKMRAGVIGAVLVIGAAILMWVQHQTQLAAREENLSLRQQLEQLAAENERLSNQVAHAAAPTANSEQERELLRLRAEVGNLRRQLAEAAAVAARAARAPQPQPQPTESAIAQEDEGKLAGIAKLNYTKGWMFAFFLFAQRNQDQLPSSFEQAAPFLPEEAKAEASKPGGSKYGITPDRYEIVYQGSIKSIGNPASAIVVREKEPWQTTDGSWMRAYAFADGHSEIHRAVDGNFGPWEAQHIAQSAATGVAQPGQ